VKALRSAAGSGNAAMAMTSVISSSDCAI